MEITEVRIAFIKPRDGMIGFASVVLDNALYLGSIGVHHKLDGSGFRLTFPTRRAGDGQAHVFHPIRQDLSKRLETAIFEKMKNVMSKADAGHGGNFLEAGRI